MSDVAIAVPTHFPAPIERKSAQHRITKRVRAAIEAMVWQGLNRADAAQMAGLQDNSLYVAFRRPEVKQAYLAECEVLRVSQRARNIHRLVDIRDAADNMPAVNAVKALEQLGDEQQQRSNGLTASAGVTIRIVNVTAPGQQTTTIAGDILNQNATNET